MNMAQQEEKREWCCVSDGQCSAIEREERLSRRTVIDLGDQTSEYPQARYKWDLVATVVYKCLFLKCIV